MLRFFPLRLYDLGRVSILVAPVEFYYMVIYPYEV